MNVSSILMKLTALDMVPAGLLIVAEVIFGHQAEIFPDATSCMCDLKDNYVWRLTTIRQSIYSLFDDPALYVTASNC
jgi:hypothetical protein